MLQKFLKLAQVVIVQGGQQDDQHLQETRPNELLGFGIYIEAVEISCTMTDDLLHTATGCDSGELATMVRTITGVFRSNDTVPSRHSEEDWTPTTESSGIFYHGL